MNKNLYQKLFSVLADGNRLTILNSLQENEKTVTEICKELNIEQSLISHHLKILKEFGFVASKIIGKNRIYSINRKVLDPIFLWADHHTKAFSKVLSHYDVEGWLNMGPVEAIDHETELVMKKIQILEKSVKFKNRIPKKPLSEMINFFNTDMETHFKVEEMTLFPLMSKKGKSDLINTLLLEHKMLRKKFAEFENIVKHLDNERQETKDELLAVSEEIIAILKIHTLKEDTILLPYVQKVLTKRELEELKRKAEKIERGV